MTNEATTPSGQPLGISHKPSKSGAMFTKFKAENKPAFIGYLPYGFPNPDVSLDAFKTMVEHVKFLGSAWSPSKPAVGIPRSLVKRRCISGM